MVEHFLDGQSLLRIRSYHSSNQVYEIRVDLFVRCVLPSQDLLDRSVLEDIWGFEDLFEGCVGLRLVRVSIFDESVRQTISPNQGSHGLKTVLLFRSWFNLVWDLMTRYHFVECDSQTENIRGWGQIVAPEKLLSRVVPNSSTFSSGVCAWVVKLSQVEIDQLSPVRFPLPIVKNVSHFYIMMNYPYSMSLFQLQTDFVQQHWHIDNGVIHITN